AYASGRHPELTKTLDILLESGERFTVARNEEIYESFFGNEGQTEAVRETSQRMQETAVGVIKELKQAGVDVAHFGEKLAAFGQEVSSGGDLRSLIEGMLRETDAAQGRNRTLEAQLGDATREIQRLRSNLEELRLEALTDGLTGLFNRKHFDAQLRRDTRQAMECGEPLCVLLSDIDHFKRFNDTYGHAIGDEVLKLVARTLKQNVKGRDTPARFGGEEFAVILPTTALANAMTLAEQMRRRLAGKELKTRDGSRSFGSVTMSLGVAQYRPGEPLPLLLQRADEALYAAKRGGRNRVMAEAAESATTQRPAAASA
ncbi:hypothetical protein AY600_07245, partial [Phormidium willei BDU 130791]